MSLTLTNESGISPLGPFSVHFGYQPPPVVTSGLSTGTVSLDGRDIRQLNPVWLRSKIGTVSQVRGQVSLLLTFGEAAFAWSHVSQWRGSGWVAPIPHTDCRLCPSDPEHLISGRAAFYLRFQTGVSSPHRRSRGRSHRSSHGSSQFPGLAMGTERGSFSWTCLHRAAWSNKSVSQPSFSYCCAPYSHTHASCSCSLTGDSCTRLEGVAMGAD